MQNDMENDFVEVFALVMAVEFPVAGIEVDFDRAMRDLTVDLNGAVDKIGTGPAVPLTRGNDGDRLLMV